MKNKVTEDQAYAYLTTVIEPPNRLWFNLIEKEGAIDVFHAVIADKLDIKITKKLVNPDELFSQLEKLENQGGGILTPKHANWPAWELICLSNSNNSKGLVEKHYPQVPPISFWYWGDISKLTKLRKSISVVGTRNPSEYGSEVTFEFVRELANSYPIISGGAIGIDALAHKAALAENGDTICILANGFEYAYPAQNRFLFDQIKTNNLILTEYPFFTSPAKHRFLYRNRLVAALSTATLIVEAPKRSGALNTAAWANRLGKVVLVVPGQITSYNSVGCNNLIANRSAELVTTVADVIAVIDPYTDTNPLPTLNETQRYIYNNLSTSMGLDLDTIYGRTNIEIAELQLNLAILELDELVSCEAGKWFRLK